MQFYVLFLFLSYPANFCAHATIFFSSLEAFLLVCHCMKNSHKQEQTDC